jgi:hypothetical protein
MRRSLIDHGFSKQGLRAAWSRVRAESGRTWQHPAPPTVLDIVEAAEQHLSDSRLPASRLAALSDSSLQTASSNFVLRLASRARMSRSLIERRSSAAS